MDVEQMVDAMSTWDPQRFAYDAPANAAQDMLQAATQTAALLARADLPPLFTLRHLEHSTGVPYKFLRAIVSRARSEYPYRVFRLKKQSAGGEERYRWIAAPHPLLLHAQRWINTEILSKLQQHPASFAYRSGRCAFDAAQRHQQARWLVKADVTNFFESILEPDVYLIFRAAGYQPLIAFELARICTRVRTVNEANARDLQTSRRKSAAYKIKAYRSGYIGHLPQGAATSPALANLIANPLDVTLSEIAARTGFRYTRYADDIAFSSASPSTTRADAVKVASAIHGALHKHGFSPNLAKSAIRGPGHRRIVLGLLVDGDRPRLTSEFKDALTLHLRHLQMSGPVAHAQARGFHSVIGLKHHIDGLIAYAKGVDSAFAAKCAQRLGGISWPLLTPFDLDTLTP
jgi:retron-type reverse transcriptase